MAFASTQQEGPLSVRRCVKQNALKLRQPTTHFFVKRLESFRLVVSKPVENAREIAAIRQQGHSWFKRCWSGYRRCVERVNSDRAQNIVQIFVQRTYLIIRKLLFDVGVHMIPSAR